MLTTPDTSIDYKSFPEAFSFHYWNVSSSLWEEKLSHYNKPFIFLPIFWAQHSENPDQYDFGDYKKHTDLKALADLVRSKNIRPIFTISINTAPYLVNGGLPSYVSKTFALNENGQRRFSIDNEGRIIHHYSFFNPRVYQYFDKFLFVLNKYFEGFGYPVEVIAKENFFYSNKRLNSYMNDLSEDFYAGYKRYLSQMDKDPKHDYTKEYQGTIQSLYMQSFFNRLQSHSIGAFKFLYTQGSDDGLFDNSASHQQASMEFFFALRRSFIPSVCLLRNDKQESLLRKISDQLLTADFYANKIEELSFGDEDDRFRSYYPISVVTDDAYISRHSLESFVDQSREYGLHYVDSLEKQKINNLVVIQQKIDSVEKIEQLLRYFFQGKIILLNKNLVHEVALNRLENFYIENNLTLDKVMFHCELTAVSLGEGKILSYDEEYLQGKSAKQQKDFWSKLLAYLKTPVLQISSDNNTLCYQCSRVSNAYELDFSHIRRVYLYNQHSSKQKISIKVPKQYAFLKSIDEHQCELKVKSKDLQLQMFPEGSITLEFGFFER